MNFFVPNLAYQREKRFHHIDEIFENTKVKKGRNRSAFPNMFFYEVILEFCIIFDQAQNNCGIPVYAEHTQGHFFQNKDKFGNI